jgi:hypothetical protein
MQSQIVPFQPPWAAFIVLTIIFGVATCAIQPALTWFYNRPKVAQALNKNSLIGGATEPLQPRLGQRVSGLQFPQATYAGRIADNFP